MRRLLPILLILFLFAVCVPAGATAYTTTATGVNWSSSTHWSPAGVPGNGDTATIANATTVDASEIIGTSPATGGTTALTISAALTVATGATLTARGPVVQGNTSITLNAGSGITFDAHLATTPLSQKYAWTSAAFVIGNRMITCSGTSGSHCTIQSNASGGDGFFTGGGGNSDSMWLDATYTDFIRIGDSTTDAIAYNPQSATHITSLQQCTFDVGSGMVDFATAPPTGGGWDIEDCYFNQSAPAAVNALACPLEFRTGNTTATGARKLYRDRFEQFPVLVGSGLDCQDCFFRQGWNDALSSPVVWANMLGAFNRTNATLTGASNELCHGGLSNCVLFIDPDYTVLSTGTATSATSTTLVNAGAPFVNAAFAATGSAVWFVEITGGTGIGQRRFISSNTTTALTIAYRWDTIPDATSTYDVVKDIANCHGYSPNANLTAATAITYDTLVAQFSGTDTQGDLFLHNAAVATTISHMIALPNSMGDCSFTPATAAFTTDTQPTTFNHNTYFTGAESFAISEGGNAAANSVPSVRSNIAWAVPGRSYFAHGGSPGPYIVSDANNPATDNADIVTASMADYNCSYGLLVNGRAHTDFPGSPVNQVGPYNYKASVAPGAHDQANTNPNFTDSTRTIWSWAVTRGSAATTIHGQIADALTFIKADPTLTRTSLIPYIQTGFTPTNAALRGAAHDGADIGAVAIPAGGSTGQGPLTGVGNRPHAPFFPVGAN